MRATKAIINISNFKHNLDIVKNLTPYGTKQCLAVKADAYGHGAIDICKAAQEYGINYLGVATVDEGTELRENGINLPVILLGAPLPEEIESLFNFNLETVLYTEEAIKNYSAKTKGRNLNVHLKIDTGMGRIGCTPENAVKIASLIKEAKGLTLAGVSTHFPVSDSNLPDNICFTNKQIEIFNQVVSEIKKAGINTGIIHAANSGAICNFPEAHFDMVRPGILAYGYLPGGKESLVNCTNKEISPRPVMTLESMLIHIKKIKKGSFVSYGRKYKAKKDTWIGTVPIGYADGYTRIFSNKSEVFINDKLYPVAGTICMDQLMVDLGPILEVQLYDKVILFGSEKNAPTAETLTKISNSIPYELLCGISKRVPRILLQ